MNPLADLNAYLYSTLSGDETLMGLITGVYAGFAPEDAAYPFVTFHLQSSSDTLGNGGSVALSEPQITVLAVNEGWSPSALGDAASRIDALLSSTTVTVQGDTRILGAVRVRPLSDEDWVQGKRFNRLGGLYRFFLEAA
jgi:hypothetical protein